MYLNRIDDLIDKVIDDFYTIVILKNKNFRKILNEENFIKHQSQINDMINNYIKEIPEDSYNEITKKKDSIDDIFDTLKRYCITYMFLTIGAHYKGKTDIFINNIIEFSKNQSQYTLRINNFFNSESNAELIKYYYMIVNILKLFERPEIRFEQIRKEPYAKETVNFLKKLGSEYIDTYLRNKKYTKGDTINNIIRTLIILLIYREKDKKKLYNIIEQVEKTEGEYIFIDVVESITDQINFMTIESLLSKEDAMAGVAHELWNYMQSVKEEEYIEQLSNDDKINILINSGIVIPILDDFLLYHKDSERYDRITDDKGKKKKEDTKIRYIIGKIDSTAELYSDSAKKNEKLKDNIMKNFASHMHNKKAIFRNDVEEIKIINKFINQGKRSQENDDYFNDLLHYRRYSFVNFKDFDKYGFSHSFNKTVTAVRAVNFNKKGDFRQINSNHKFQRRVGSNGSIGNIVGLMIPPNTKSIQCLKISDAIDIRSKGSKNGYYPFFKKLVNNTIKQTDNNKAYYWLFDLKTDSIKSTKSEAATSSSQDISKSLVAGIYDGMINQIYHEIINIIDMVPNITPHMAEKIIKYMEKNILKVPLDTKIKSSIKSHLYKRYPTDPNNTHIEEYDDTLYGIEGDIFELPEYTDNKLITTNKVTIDLSEVEVTGKVIDVETVEGVCQHNITWDEISLVKRIDQSKYMKNMYDFIQQYVVEDTTGAYVCKSCGYYLDITRYITDGKFDDSSQKFVTFSMPMEVDIAALPEYRKLDFTIKLMDKNIDKICSSVGIPYFVGSNITTKWRRQGIIKNTIDMVRANNSILTKIFKARNEKKETLYGVSKNLSSLFVFEMENAIYIRSSKDKDQEQFKMIKRNNIVTYIMIFLIMELNESQISFFAIDKKSMCDIRIFDKVYSSLFKGLRIKKNNANETVPITNYKILCYVIYMLSCRIAKHRMWYSSQSVQKNIVKMIPIIQRFIVHTFVDILNSILENSFKPNVSYIFEIFRVRFYSKLSDLFINDDYYDVLLNLSKEQYAIAKRRGVVDPSKVSIVPPFKFMKPVWRTVLPRRHFLRYKIYDPVILNGVTNLSHCPSGDYHEWKIGTFANNKSKKRIVKKGDNFICTICSANMAKLQYDEALSKKIVEKFKIKSLNRLALKFCLVDGQPHEYMYNSEKEKNICGKCKNSDTHEYIKEELKIVAKLLDMEKKERRENQIAKNKSYEELDKKNTSYIESVVEKNLKSLESVSVSETKNKFKYIDNFVAELQEIVGDEIKGKFPIHLIDNTYIIDHDHYGHKLSGNPIIIKESDKKINVKVNHSHYKTDVIYYTDYSTGKVDVFYDTVSRRLLGYKESSKDYVDLERSDKKIRINYSTSNKLKLMGYTAQYINIYDSYPELAKKYDGKSINERQPLYRKIISNICRERMERLKKIMLDFQRIINRIVNKYVPEKMTLLQSTDSKSGKEDKSYNIVSNEEYSNRGKYNNYSKYKKNKPSASKIRTDFVPYTKVSSNPYAPESPTYFADKLDDIIERFQNKLANVSLSQTDKKHKIFKHWKAISRGIDSTEKSDIFLNSESDVLDLYVVNRYDTESHQLLYYIVSEFSKFINYNKSSFIKTSVANFLTEFIDRIFFEFNTEHIMTNSDIRRFMYIISSTRYVKEVSEEAENDVQLEGFYNEVVDTDIEVTSEDIEQKIDMDEELDAIDVDMSLGDLEEGFESGYERAAEYAEVQFNRSISRS
jgi:hypothetical protein